MVGPSRPVASRTAPCSRPKAATPATMLTLARPKLGLRWARPNTAAWRATAGPGPRRARREDWTRPRKNSSSTNGAPTTSMNATTPTVRASRRPPGKNAPALLPENRPPPSWTTTKLTRPAASLPPTEAPRATPRSRGRRATAKSASTRPVPCRRLAATHAPPRPAHRPASLTKRPKGEPAEPPAPTQAAEASTDRTSPASAPATARAPECTPGGRGAGAGGRSSTQVVHERPSHQRRAWRPEGSGYQPGPGQSLTAPG